MLLPIENLLSTTDIMQAHTLLHQGTWIDGSTTSGNLASQVKNNLQLTDDCDATQQLQALVLEKLQRTPLFTSASLAKTIYPPKFSCYQTKQAYGQHVDGAIMRLPNGQSMRTDLSATLFFSDPNEYEGGELVIETQYGLQEVKLPAGDMILYPSTSLHHVTLVLSGQRFVSFFWIESLVRDNQQREILFDLDQSIQSLRLQQQGETQEITTLSGIYHNLLRQWAS